MTENKKNISQISENKTSKAQVRASRNWEKNNPEKTKYIKYRSSARTFARHWADDEDMEEIMNVYRNENPNYKKDE